MRADVRENGGDVLRHDEIASGEEGMGLRHPAEGQRATGADAKLDHGMGAGGLGKGGDIVKDAVVGLDGAGLLNEVQELVLCDDGLDAIEGIFAVAVAQNVDLAAVIGIAHAEADEEAVKLRTRKQRCTSRTGGVLRREDDKRRREVVGLAVHGDAVFLHRFQKGGLRFAGGTVDLVGQQEIGHDRTGLVDEGIDRFIVHRVADDIRGDGVRGELDTAGVES